jgi:tetratricopeptide (TPR) repeat protein
MKALTAVITALSVPLLILNLLGAIVSGIWLVVIGEWRPVGLGILFFFGSSFLLSFALMPGMLLAAPAAWFAARGKTLGLVLFGTLSSIYTLALVTLWCCSVLFLFVKDATAGSIIPRLIWSYGIATGPWAYMASQEQGPDGEGFASTMSTFLAQLAYLVIMLLVLFAPVTVLGAIKVFAGFMLVGLALQIAVAVIMERERNDQSKGIHSAVVAWRESAGKELEVDNTLLSVLSDKFREGYGPSGWQICEYADVLAAAKIENSHSRSESELPSTPDQIKLAILEVTELAIANKDDGSAFELLRMAYSSLARFLPDSKAEIVTARNLAYPSEDADHPSLRKSTEAHQIEAEVDAEESRLGEEFDQIVADYHHRKTFEKAEAFREAALAYRESASRVLEADNTLLSDFRHLFGEGCGPNGLLVCDYVDVLAKATIENSGSRSESELPANPEKIKHAIRHVAELAIARQEDEPPLEPLRIAYTFLARFLPESQASLVTKHNLGLFSGDPNRPDLAKSDEEEEQRIEAEVEAEQCRLEHEFDQIVSDEHGRKSSETGSMLEAVEILEVTRTEYREALGIVMKIDNDLLAPCRNRFGEGYGPGGLLVRAFADVIARATIENSRSRSESELPASPAKLKEALIEVAELAIAQQRGDLDLESLKVAYCFLARFLPESEANLVTGRNLSQLSQDLDHPGLLRSGEAEEIDAKVAAEEDRLEQEFCQVIIERLENEKAKSRRQMARIEIEMAKALLEMSPGDPGGVTEILLEEFRGSSPTEGTSAKYCGDGLIAWRQGDRETAFRLYTKAVELDSRDAVALLNRGNLQLEMGRFEAGIADLEQAREMVPELPCGNADLFKMLGPDEREEWRQRLLKKERRE